MLLQVQVEAELQEAVLQGQTALLDGSTLAPRVVELQKHSQALITQLQVRPGFSILQLVLAPCRSAAVMFQDCTPARRAAPVVAAQAHLQSCRRGKASGVPVQELQAVHDHSAPIKAAFAPLAERAVQCTQALGTLQAVLPLRVACPDACVLLAPILRKLGRSERSAERTAQLVDQLSCAFATAVCQVLP